MADAVGVIGGSGLYLLDGFTDVREVAIDTPFGAPSDAITVGRLGGNEFVVLMPELTAPADAMGLAEKIRVAVREPILFEGQSMRISCSLGIAVYPDDGTDETTLVRNADQAMYRAKERGRDAAVLAGES